MLTQKIFKHFICFFVFFIIFCKIEPSSASFKKISDVQYLNIPGVSAKRLSLDIYIPTCTSYDKIPVVLFVHGGRWSRGDKSGSSFNRFRDLILSEGYMAVAVNHRLSPDWIFPTHAFDVVNAIAWIYKNITKYNGNPEKMVLSGHSSGAQIVSYIGTRPELLRYANVNPGAVKGIISLDGTCYDVEDALVRNAGTKYEKPFKEAFGDDPELWRESSAMFHVFPGKPLPSFLFIHAQADWFESEIFVSVLKKSGADVRAVKFPVSHAEVITKIGKNDEYSFVIKDYLKSEFEKD